MVIIQHDETDLSRISLATHYQPTRGVVSRIKTKESRCHCGLPTMVTTHSGMWSTFTRAHLMAGCRRTEELT